MSGRAGGDRFVDAVVCGAGPAGSAAAIVLGLAGWRVVLVGRAATAGDRAGESLSPAAPALLARLGVRERFLVDGHLRCHANASAWGGAELQWHDFVRDPRGSGFHVDRRRFEAMLRARAVEAGASLIVGEAPRVVGREGGRWRLDDGGAVPPTARHLIDATGRGATLARACGAQRRRAWRQEALVGFARAARPTGASFTLIEAVRDGFWYSAPIPGGRFALALFTDASLHDVRVARTTAGFESLLAGTSHTRERWAAHGAALEEAPRFVGAGSAWLDPVYGPGWIAAGDAAITYDPIAAHGLTLALRTGIDAADALLADSTGDHDALPRYAARLTAAFTAYRREAARVYRSEPRWPDAPYWCARHMIE